MSKRAKTAAALASLGVVAAGWQAVTVNGQAAITTPTTTTATPAEATTSPTPSGVSGTFTGSTAAHRFGSVTVTATVVNGKITKLTEQVVDDGDRHSQSINQQAIPMLRRQILAANSADVSTVSGATYSTEAYLTSLQSALDQASR